MEAPNALMEMENVRIVKEMRNAVNRQVNCETANINKTVSAASKQTDDILYIERTIGLAQLPEGLQEIAELRVANPNASLKELGEMLTEPIGKSGVNHRLRKLSEIAEEIRKGKEE
jgi:DNA-binding protein WhiA